MKRYMSLAILATSTAIAVLCLFSLYFTNSETREQLLVALLAAGITFAAVAAVELRVVRLARSDAGARLASLLPFGALALGAVVLLSASSIGIFNSSMVAVGAPRSVLLAATVAASWFAIGSAWHLRGLKGLSESSSG